jgi:hypothetical protein
MPPWLSRRSVWRWTARNERQLGTPGFFVVRGTFRRSMSPGKWRSSRFPLGRCEHECGRGASQTGPPWLGSHPDRRAGGGSVKGPGRSGERSATSRTVVRALQDRPEVTWSGLARRLVELAAIGVAVGAVVLTGPGLGRVRHDVGNATARSLDVRPRGYGVGADGLSLGAHRGRRR